MEIIKATIAHVAVLAALHAQGFPDDPWDKDAFARLLVLPGTHGRLAVDSETAVHALGFAVWRHVVDEGELLAITVGAKWRGQGIGHAIMWDGIFLLERKNCRNIFLEVAINNVQANNLYQDLGFYTIAKRRGYYKRAGSEPVDALLMRREYRE